MGGAVGKPWEEPSAWGTGCCLRMCLRELGLRSNLGLIRSSLSTPTPNSLNFRTFVLRVSLSMISNFP